MQVSRIHIGWSSQIFFYVYVKLNLLFYMALKQLLISKNFRAIVTVVYFYRLLPLLSFFRSSSEYTFSMIKSSKTSEESWKPHIF